MKSNESGQITIIPKPEFKVIFGGESFTKPPFRGDRSRRFGCYNFPVDELNALEHFFLEQPKSSGTDFFFGWFLQPQGLP